MTSPPAASPPTVGTPLTADGALTLHVEERARSAVTGWLPRHLALAPLATDPPSDLAAIHVRPVGACGEGDGSRGGDDGDPVAVFGPVTVRARGNRLMLATPTPTYGAIDLATRQATLDVAPAMSGADDAVRAMLTMSAAALLGRLGRALTHAAAVVAPDGRAWLLVGDTHSGKSTTCATLLEAGWRYCSDDHVVLSAHGEDIHVEGWPRVLHLDGGWEAGQPVGGARDAVDAFARWPGGWRPTAAIAGVLLPTVVADAATCLLPATPASRLTMLVRQSPWLFMDRATAPAVLALLGRVALLPGATLRLGRDTFRQPTRLTAALAPLLARKAPA